MVDTAMTGHETTAGQHGTCPLMSGQGNAAGHPDRTGHPSLEDVRLSGLSEAPRAPSDLAREEPDNRAGLRARLLAMRAELVERLACDKIEGGTLALLAGINAAIEAYEAAAEEPADVVATGRAVLSDDGAAITLTLYTQANPVAAVALAPHRAVALAGELIAAALPRLGAR